MNSETVVSTKGLSNVRVGSYPPPVLRILFVIDGRVQLDKHDFSFGLGFVLDTLNDPSWNAVDTQLSIATREASISDFARDGREVKYINFRFTQPDFNINEWDQIWFFADQPNFDDGGALDTDDMIVPLDDGEALLLAQWMDHGGGVFATGDHGIL